MPGTYLPPNKKGKQLEPEIAFGLVLRELRKKKGLSQEALALEAGIERNYVSLIELGRNSASVKMVFKFGAVLNTPPSKLFEMAEEKMRHSKSS